MTTILTPTAEHAVATCDGVWTSAGDAERVTGWTLKPEGMCRAALCVPLRPEMVRGREVDIEAFWKALGGPVIKSDDGDVWALAAPAGERNAALEGLEALDFTLRSLWRQAADLDEVGKVSGPGFWQRVQALGDKPYYPPPKL